MSGIWSNCTAIARKLLSGELNSSFVATDTKPANHSLCLVAQKTAVPKLLSSVDVADVDIDKGYCDSCKCVLESNTGVGETSGVDYYKSSRSTSFVGAVEDGAFVVRLEGSQLQTQ